MNEPNTTTWTPDDFRESFWESAAGEAVEFVKLGCTILGMLAYYPIFRMKERADHETKR